jgi:hypothetical protein
MNGLLASRLRARSYKKQVLRLRYALLGMTAKTGHSVVMPGPARFISAEACNASHGARNDLYEFGDWQRAEAI